MRSGPRPQRAEDLLDPHRLLPMQPAGLDRGLDLRQRRVAHLLPGRDARAQPHVRHVVVAVARRLGEDGEDELVDRGAVGLGAMGPRRPRAAGRAASAPVATGRGATRCAGRWCSGSTGANAMVRAPHRDPGSRDWGNGSMTAFRTPGGVRLRASSQLTAALLVSVPLAAARSPPAWGTASSARSSSCFNAVRAETGCGGCGPAGRSPARRAPTAATCSGADFLTHPSSMARADVRPRRVVPPRGLARGGPRHLAGGEDRPPRCACGWRRRATARCSSSPGFRRVGIGRGPARWAAGTVTVYTADLASARYVPGTATSHWRPGPTRARLPRAGDNRLIESRLTPNAISLTGFSLCLVAAVLIWQDYYLLGGIAFIVGSVCDAMDGRYSRLSGKGTPFGAFLDSTLDRLEEGVVLTAVALNSRSGDHFAVAAVVVAVWPP